MTPEQAAYYRLMLLLGEQEEYEAELDRLLQEQEPLSPLVLELAFCMSDLLQTCSVLYNYTLDHPADENKVCAMVRERMIRRYREKTMTPEQIADFLYRAARAAENCFDDPWDRLCYFSYDLEMYEDHLVSREVYIAAFEARLFHDRHPNIWAMQQEEDAKKPRFGFFRKK